MIQVPKKVSIGETGRSLFERSSEHLDDALNHRDSSHIWKHWADCHPDLLEQPLFKFKVIKVHKSSLDRQIHEAIKISDVGSLNAKCEFRQNQVKRLSVSMTAKKIREVESKAARLDHEISVAVTRLADRLKKTKFGNKGSKLSSFYVCDDLGSLISPNPHPTTDLENVIFTDISQKRPFSDQFSIGLQPKRVKLEKMGHKSKGNSAYELNYVRKLVDFPKKTNKLEKSRSTPSTLLKTPTTFAEAALMSRQRTQDRSLLSCRSSTLNPARPGFLSQLKMAHLLQRLLVAAYQKLQSRLRYRGLLIQQLKET